MRVFTKRILIMFLAAFLGISVVGCGNDETTEETPNDSITPAISNPDGIFLTSDDYSVTYQELYDEVKKNDGLNQLLNLVDTDLLSSYISVVTEPQIDNKKLELIYGTDDLEIIEEFTADEKAQAELTYEQSMVLLGYTTDELEEDYIRLTVAREAYAIEAMLNADNSEEAWYAGPSIVADYYELQYNPDINSIKIKFSSKAEANSFLRSYNLVSATGELLLYTGDGSIDEVIIDSSNSRSLTDAEVLEYFLEIYNDIYGGYRDEIPTDSSLEDLLAMDDLSLEYDVLTSANASLPDFMYEAMGNYSDYTTDVNDLLYYTFEPVKYDASTGNAYYMILNLSQEEKVDVEDFDGTEADLVALIGQELYDELEQEMIDLNISSSSFISNRIVELRAENSFDIYDYYLAKDYSSLDYDFEINEDGHATVVAVYGSEEITADELFSYAFELNASMYTIYASQSKSLIAAHYEEIYCTDGDVCEFDVSLNESEKMEEHRTSLLDLETQFDASYYASYYTFEEYLYLAYGAKDDNEMLYNYYVKSTLQPLLIYDEILDGEYDILNDLLDLSQPYYDNFFSLDTEHVLIYVDRDEDGTPDDYETFYEELEDQAAYDTKLSAFEAAIRLYLDDEDNTMYSLVEDYEDAKRDDATWGEFVTFGFYLLNESLGEISYNDSIGVYEDGFVDALIDLYGVYTLEENIEKDSLLADTLFETSYGLHLILVEPGTSFDKPSAKFEMTYDDENDPEYLAGLVNDTDLLTFEQLKIYADYRFYEIAYLNADLEEMYGLEQPDMPEELLEAIEYYYQDLYDALYVIGYLNQIVIDELSQSTYVNEDQTYLTLTQSEFNDNITTISDIYMVQIFQELDQRESE